MKNLAVICFLFISLAGFSQYGIIKTTGDTLWYKTIDIKFVKGDKIESITGKNDTITESILVTDVAFVIYPGQVKIVQDDGRLVGDKLLISGKNNYLVLVIENDIYNYNIYNRNREFQSKITQSPAALEELKEYFGDCTEFISEIDKEAPKFKTKKFPHATFETIARRYNCK
ncbi:MAG: hypothetical protein M3R17_07960 [Bacteroidota bacterium]|nr:hypothetical protein [Bacteroidota bacterium]